MAEFPRHWRPLEIAPEWTFHRSEELIQVAMEHYGMSREDTLARIHDDERHTEVWINDLYQVEVREWESGYTQLNVRRRDGAAMLRDWRHLQAIKNQLLGEECEAVELYPAESRLVDTSNKYHLWGKRDPKFRFPFGLPARDVMYLDSKTPGMRQRKL